jgi:hypothetical protein
MSGESAALKDALIGLPAVDQVVIRDFEGGEHTLSCVLPARRQALVFAALGDLIAAGSGAFSAESSGTGLLKVLVDLLTDEALLERLGSAFRAAYPDAAGGRDPLDIFPMEELVAGLLPLVVRQLRRAALLLTAHGE